MGIIYDGNVVSIHVPARGTTAVQLIITYLSLRFQSTFPQGERLIVDALSDGYDDVSIHVPARGTTYTEDKSREERVVSIHVPARGTTSDRPLVAASQRFQSTFPQGERRIFQMEKSAPKSFNPRSRKGNDLMSPAGTCTCRTFQSTFPQGERPLAWKNPLARYKVSIHVPARGTTSSSSVISPSTHTFQSTFPQGERPYESRRDVYVQDVSIHVPARGTTYRQYCDIAEDMVSIHVPARGTTPVTRGSQQQVLWSSIFVTLVAKKYRFMQFELDMVFDTH